MTTLADLRDRLRIELHDEDDERWADATLDRHLARALRELSSRAPRERKSTLSTTAGSREISLTSLTDLVDVLAVEYPTGLYPPRYVQFSSFASALTLLIDEAPAAVEDVNVYWGAVHEVDGVASSLPVVHEDIVVLGAGGYAATEWAAFAVNRANIAGIEAFEQYAAWGAEALRRFEDQLRQLREVSRVKVSSLFTPASGQQPSQSVVQWEP